MDRSGQERVRKFADAVRDKVFANADLIAMADERVTINVYPKGSSFDVKLTVTK